MQGSEPKKSWILGLGLGFWFRIWVYGLGFEFYLGFGFGFESLAPCLDSLTIGK